MSTTRHLINRRRRAAAATETPPTRAKSTTTTTAADPVRAKRPGPVRTVKVQPKPRPQQTEDKPSPTKSRPPAPSARRGLRLPIVLGVLTVLLGGFAAFATVRTSEAGDAGSGNAALTDAALTSEVKGGVTEAVNAVFSVDYADTGKNEAAAQKYLTGTAVEQHQTMLAEVKAQAAKKKLVLTTTVTDVGVESLQGERARVLVFADQRNTGTDKKEETTYGAAMLAVDTVRTDGVWKIANIETFTR
ncbi:hypothetical protein SRB5_62040 [Streptomyces sp. RB5]|uniref:Mce-associated membrane protein n=1 Tax=Streptomyces smaragdinus TaxID=2585196 RepID=A0A7K0CSM5_9ACTN|nr:hypothetical protein [Streptomyces smaragdinus]MQY16012.1 hypothetical protein [Streptomyces smaragdinus]